ncbi:MAG TPA: hypothetical protein VFJ57_01195 [Solirubrobacterales bacterium]|nr:hypothetical protein [Solirubrobacterales bacterium]
MIELTSYSVAGLRSLAGVPDIPVRRPTIITGANDGGKSTALLALNFLLGGRAPTGSDLTLIGSQEDGADPLSHERIEVTGTFRLDQHDMDALGLESEVLVRRVWDVEGGARYEMRVNAPTDPRFHTVESLRLKELASLAEDVGVEPVGARNTRAAWLEPLVAYAGALPHEAAWIAAPSDLVLRLPRMMLFSSTDEPDPEGQIRSALKTAFSDLLEEPDLVGPVREVEKAVQGKLAQKADDLCTHVTERCPELESIDVKPEVTFTEAFATSRSSPREKVAFQFR